MKKISAGIVLLISLGVSSCYDSSSGFFSQPENVQEETNKNQPKIELKDGVATFQKKGGDVQGFTITIHDRGYKQFNGEGDAPHIVVDWSDGFTSAYMFYIREQPDAIGIYHDVGKGLVYDYNKTTKSWGKGEKITWEYVPGGVEITSVNGSVTGLGGVTAKLKTLLADFKRFQDQQGMFDDMNLAILDREFKTNRIRARKSYEYKRVTVRGTVNAIYDDHMEICQESNECLTLWYGTFRDSGLTDWLAARNSGDRVTVTGSLVIKVALGTPSFLMDNWKIANGFRDGPVL